MIESSMVLRNESNLGSMVERQQLVDFDRPHRYVDVGHSELAYWSVGQGPDLVLVHGWPIHSATYRNLLPYLSKHFTCHLFDLPGVGQTKTGSNAPFGLNAHARTLSKAINSVGIEKYALLGHDSGAAIMQIVAAENPQSVTCLVMGNTETPGYHSFMMRFLMTASKIPKAGELLFWALRFKTLRHSNFGLGCAFADKELIEGRFFDLFLKPVIHSKAARQGQLKLFNSLDPNEVEGLLEIQKNCTLPVQLQWGSDDPYFLLEDAKKMKKRFKAKSEMHVYEGGKLFIHEEFPERFSKLAVGFILNNQ